MPVWFHTRLFKNGSVKVSILSSYMDYRISMREILREYRGIIDSKVLAYDYNLRISIKPTLNPDIV